MNTITKEKLASYFTVTGKALEKAQQAGENLNITDVTRKEFLEMIR